MDMQEYYQKDEIDLADYFRVLNKRKKTIFMVLFFCALAIIAVIFLVPDEYEAISVVRIGRCPQPAYNAKDISCELQNLNNLTEQIKPFEFEGDLGELRNSIVVENLDAPGFIKIRIRASSPKLAVKICDRLANFTVIKGNEICAPRLELLNSQIQKLEKSKSAADKDKAISLKQEIMEYKDSRIVSVADSGRRPIISKNRADNIFFIFISGLALSVLIVSLQEFWAKNKERHG